MKGVFLRFLTFYVVTDLSRLTVKLFTRVLLWTCYIINHVFKNVFENIQNAKFFLISIFSNDPWAIWRKYLHEIWQYKALCLNHFLVVIMSASYLSLDCSFHFLLRGWYRIWHIYCSSWKNMGDFHRLLQFARFFSYGHTKVHSY